MRSISCCAAIGSVDQSDPYDSASHEPKSPSARHLVCCWKTEGRAGTTKQHAQLSAREPSPSKTVI